MLELLYSSGIRPDELLGLDTDRIDLPNQLARVLGKGRKERMVPFGRTARRFVETYLRGVRPLQLREPGETALWLNRDGRRLRYHTFRRQLAELGRQLKVPTNRITGILNGQRAVTGDTALRLAHFFGTSAEFWLNLQKVYELRLAEAKAGTAIRRLPRLQESRRTQARAS